MKNIFKKAITILGSAALIGMTIGAATAASYPSPFIGNTAIVVGANAAPSDNIAASNIASNLNANAIGGTLVLSGDGDVYKFEKSSVKFHLGDNLQSIKSVLDNDELPTLLNDGKFTDDNNDEFDYIQEIRISPNLKLSMWEDNDYKEDIPTIGFKIPSGSNVLEYTISFEDTPYLKNLDTSILSIMGKDYYILSSELSGTDATISLLDTATSSIVTEGESKIIKVDGKQYDVSIGFINENKVKLIINDETTNSIGESQDYKLDDGSHIYIKDIMYTPKDSKMSKVEFSIGYGKLKLTNNAEIRVNDNSVSGVSSMIGISNNNTKLNSIKIIWDADDDLFITEEQGILMPEFESVKLSFLGLTYPTKEIIKVSQGGDNYMILEDFPLKSTATDIAFLYGDNNVFTGIGKDENNRLITSNGTSITFDKDTDEYFIVSYSNIEGESYLMRATNFVLDGSSEEVNIQYMKDGSWVDRKTGVRNGDTFSIGNAELSVGLIDRLNKSVVINANSLNTDFYHLYSKEGLKVTLPFGNINTSSFNLNFTEEDKNENVGKGAQFNVTLGWSGNEVEVSGVEGEKLSDSIEIENTDIWRSFIYSPLATEILWEKPNSGQDSVKIIYHGDEVIADVYITSSDATTTTEDNGVMTVIDTNINSVSGKNLIIVGGSAINSIAAELLGGAYSEGVFTSATGVAAGEFLIQSFNRNTKVALLVAGYNAVDTEKAVEYLINNDDIDTTIGKKYKGTSSGITLVN